MTCDKKLISHPIRAKHNSGPILKWTIRNRIRNLDSVCITWSSAGAWAELSFLSLRYSILFSINALYTAKSNQLTNWFFPVLVRFSQHFHTFHSFTYTHTDTLCTTICKMHAATQRKRDYLWCSSTIYILFIVVRNVSKSLHMCACMGVSEYNPLNTRSTKLGFHKITSPADKM